MNCYLLILTLDDKYKESVMERKRLKTSIKRIISTIVFLTLVYFIYSKVVYAYRPAASSDRQRTRGFKNETVDLEAVFIGASVDLHGWEPMRAYSEHGFTSYNYCINGIMPEEIQLFIQQAVKYQPNSLYVINVQQFLGWTADEQVIPLTGGLYSTDFDLNRIQFLNYCFKYRNNISFDTRINYYLEMPIYVSSGYNANWAFSSNEYPEPDFRGYEPWKDRIAQEEPFGMGTEIEEPIGDSALAILDNLISYCKKENISVLFYLSPYCIGEEEAKKVNFIENFFLEKECDFINLNRAYSEIGIDFTYDFGDTAHLNPYGAEKMTNYLAEYLVKNYTFADHKGTVGYENWDYLAAQFLEQDIIDKQETDLTWENRE